MLDQQRRLLVVRRGQEPAQGLWSIPGGRLEAGESLPEAVRREVREETGVAVEVGELAGVVQRPGREGTTYLIHDFHCQLVGPAVPVAGDDADDARWVSLADLRSLPTTPGLLEALLEWQALPD